MTAWYVAPVAIATASAIAAVANVARTALLLRFIERLVKNRPDLAHVLLTRDIAPFRSGPPRIQVGGRPTPVPPPGDALGGDNDDQPPASGTQTKVAS